MLSASGFHGDFVIVRLGNNTEPVDRAEHRDQCFAHVSRLHRHQHRGFESFSTWQTIRRMQCPVA